MRITYENDKALTLIYIYIREFDGNIVSTLSNVRSEMIFDKDDNWIGIEVFNDTFDNNKIKLPNIKKRYNSIQNEIFEQSESKLFTLFDKNRSESYRKEFSCNIDYNSINGLQGIELILDCSDIKVDVAQQFIRKSGLRDLNEL